MLDQLFNIVKQFGQDSVVNNKDVPNEYNQEVMADATHTIAGGLQNIMAGGGLEHILDLFKGGGNAGSGNTGLLKSPIVSMMVGYFIKKLVNKYSMSPSAAGNVANNLIPNAINGLIQQANDPNNPKVSIGNLVGSLTGENSSGTDQTKGGPSLEDVLNKFTGGGNTNSSGNGFNLQDIIGTLTQKTQNNLQNSSPGGGGLMDIIKGFM